jgi:hypothetical protein
MRGRRVVGLMVLGLGCGTRPPPPVAPPTAVQVERVREALQVTPLELVWSGARGVVQEEESVALRNVGDGQLQIIGLDIVGPDAIAFRLARGARLPLFLQPAATFAIGVAFAPPATAEPGVRRATLRVQVGPRGDTAPSVDLAGLVTVGRAGNDEPALAEVLDALGFRVATGGTLRLGTGAQPLGDEVRVSRFARAKPGAVSLYPVARFSSNDRVAYGIYSAGSTVKLAAVAAYHGQTLNPELEPDARTTFDPPGESFGVFETAGASTLHTDDALNGGRHAARVYPLTSRTGARLANGYAIAFDEDASGDYQDCVFVIWNVVPAG